MVWIPAGSFTMGDSDPAIHDSTTGVRNNPRHTVYLAGYYISRDLVTVGQYREFCRMTGHALPAPPPWGWRDDHPIVNVNWEDARAYCAWAGVRLPTEKRVGKSRARRRTVAAIRGARTSTRRACNSAATIESAAPPLSTPIWRESVPTASSIWRATSGSGAPTGISPRIPQPRDRSPRSHRRRPTPRPARRFVVRRRSLRRFARGSEAKATRHAAATTSAFGPSPSRGWVGSSAVSIGGGLSTSVNRKV